MIEYNFTIEIKLDQDLKEVLKILKANEIKYELTKHSDRPSTVVSFDSDYGEHELIGEIETKFNFYDSKRQLKAGKFDIRMIICRYQSPLNTDKWGRLVSSHGIEEHFFLVIEEDSALVDVRLKQINANSFVGILPARDRKTNETGFMVYVFPTKTHFMADLNNGQQLFATLFKTESEAFEQTQKTLQELREKREAEQQKSSGL